MSLKESMHIDRFHSEQHHTVFWTIWNKNQTIKKKDDILQMTCHCLSLMWLLMPCCSLTSTLIVWELIYLLRYLKAQTVWLLSFSNSLSLAHGGCGHVLIVLLCIIASLCFMWHRYTKKSSSFFKSATDNGNKSHPGSD